jgi:hypothetical protein
MLPDGVQFETQADRAQSLGQTFMVRRHAYDAGRRAFRLRLDERRRPEDRRRKHRTKS